MGKFSSSLGITENRSQDAGNRSSLLFPPAATVHKKAGFPSGVHDWRKAMQKNINPQTRSPLGKIGACPKGGSQ